MTPPSAHRAGHPGPLRSMDDTPPDTAARMAGDHAEHVTPAYVDAPGAAVPRAPLGHALDPHPKLEQGAASPGERVDHTTMHHEASSIDAGGEHAGMAHDMSDPAMAATMERDIRTRFWAALLLTIPTVLLSPLGERFLPNLFPETFPRDWAMLLLATPVVFWSGWIFISIQCPKRTKVTSIAAASKKTSSPPIAIRTTLAT